MTESTPSYDDIKDINLAELARKMIAGDISEESQLSAICDIVGDPKSLARLDMDFNLFYKMINPTVCQALVALVVDQMVETRTLNHDLTRTQALMIIGDAFLQGVMKNAKIIIWEEVNDIKSREVAA